MEANDDSNRELTEEKLLNRLRDGDHSVRDEIFSLYFDRLYSFVFNSVDRDKMVAEDITQETLLSVVKSLASFDYKSKFYTWIIGIARHKIADHYRVVQKERGQGVYRFENGIPDTNSNDVPAADIIESIETGVTVRNALKKLQLKYRQVLMLKYVEEMSVAEISRAMGISQKSVEGLLTRARKKLRDNLEAGEG